jgi:hypothetical protein
VALARAGRRVCLVDLDPQAHATLHAGVTPGSHPLSAYDVLVAGQPLAAATYKVVAVNYQGVNDAGKRAWQVAKRSQVTPKTRWPDAEHSGKFAAPPALKRVIAREDPTAVLVEFTQAVNKAAAMNRASYRIDGGVNIHAVCEGPNRATYVLKTSPLVKAQKYRVSVAESSAVEFDLKTTDWKIVDRDLQFSIATVEHGGRCLNLNGNGYGMKSRGELQDAKLEVPEGNEFVALVRDDLKGDFDFRIRVLNLQKGGKIGIVAANDVQNPAKGGFCYLALERGRGQETGGFEAGYVAAKADAVPGEINTRQRVPHSSGLSNPTPLWTCWLRLKRQGNIFSAYYFTTQDFDTYYTERPIKDEDWVLLKTFETLGTADCSQVGVFATSGTPGDTGENHVAVQVGPQSWVVER